MTKRKTAKYKVDRRLGCNLWGRPKSPFNKRNSRPGQHGATGHRRKLSDYGNQLFAKQKLRFYYGDLTEKHGVSCLSDRRNRRRPAAGDAVNAHPATEPRDVRPLVLCEVTSRTGENPRGRGPAEAHLNPQARVRRRFDSLILGTSNGVFSRVT